jgi:hypothetical protein
MGYSEFKFDLLKKLQKQEEMKLEEEFKNVKNDS